MTFSHAVITGAGSGLGRAIALRLARPGAKLLLADIDLEGAEETARLCEGRGATARALVVDVADAAQVERLGVEADGWLGRIDLVVNNAGVAAAGTIGEIPLDDWRWIVGINLFGVIHGCHVFAPRLERQRRGHVVNVASAAGLLSPPRMAPYNTTKAAVIALSETLHADLSPHGVGVSVLCPTFFRTNLVKSQRTSTDEVLRAAARGLVEKSKVTAETIARATLDGVEKNALFVAPQADGRWMWRLKRLAPESFLRLSPKVAERLLSRKAPA